MTRNYCVAVVFAIFVGLFTASLGWCSAPQENEGVLADSKIKKNSFKKEVVQRIKKSLPKHLRKCAIIVTNIKLLRADDELNVAEEWAVSICQEEIVYFVSTSTSPKGYWVNNVKPREEQFALEKETLREWRALLDDEKFTKGFYYYDEILNDAEFKKWIEEDKNTEVKRIEYKIGNQTHEKYIRVKKKGEGQTGSIYLEIARKKIKELGLDVKNMDCRDKTTKWEDLLKKGDNEEQFSGLSKKLTDKDFVVINCSPKDINVLGGTISIFIDRETEEIIDVLRGQ